MGRGFPEARIFLRGAAAKARQERGFQASILNWSVEEARNRPRQPNTLAHLPFDRPTEIENTLPLYEGQLANRYDHRARTYTDYRGHNKHGRYKFKEDCLAASDREW